MQEVSGNIYRPLLSLQKKNIVTYLQKNSLAYLEDESNTKNEYTRNFIRNEISPRLSQVHPEYKKNIKNLLEYFENMKTFLDSAVDVFLGEKKSFCVKEFLKESDFLQKEIIRSIYFLRNHHSTIGLSEKNIAEILRFISEKR